MYWFKACPKCHGDIYSDGDTYGSYLACMQCGHYLSQAEESRLETLNARPDQRLLASVVESRLAA